MKEMADYKYGDTVQKGHIVFAQYEADRSAMIFLPGERIGHSFIDSQGKQDKVKILIAVDLNAHLGHEDSLDLLGFWSRFESRISGEFGDPFSYILERVFQAGREYERLKAGELMDALLSLMADLDKDALAKAVAKLNKGEVIRIAESYTKGAQELSRLRDELLAVLKSKDKGEKRNG